MESDRYQRTHFCRTVYAPRAVCGVEARDGRPLIFWDLRLWDSKSVLPDRCINCARVVSSEVAEGRAYGPQDPLRTPGGAMKSADMHAPTLRYLASELDNEAKSAQLNADETRHIERLHAFWDGIAKRARSNARIYRKRASRAEKAQKKGAAHG